jgi:hypothetical protein
MQIVIIYDGADRRLREFFADMEKYRPQGKIYDTIALFVGSIISEQNRESPDLFVSEGIDNNA